jgi:hypothetical protein
VGNRQYQNSICCGFGPIVDDGKASQELCMTAFGLPLLQKEDGHLFTEELEGAKHFTLWPLSLVAQA